MGPNIRREYEDECGRLDDIPVQSDYSQGSTLNVGEDEVSMGMNC